MTAPAAPTRTGPLPSLDEGQSRIFPLYDRPASASDFAAQELHHGRNVTNNIPYRTDNQFICSQVCNYYPLIGKISGAFFSLGKVLTEIPCFRRTC